MVNINKLKGRIIEKGFSMEKLADSMKINKSTLYRKFASSGDNLTIKEIDTIIKILELNQGDITSIFFTQAVAWHAN